MAAPPAAPKLPRLRHPDPLIQGWADQLVRALEVELQRLATPQGAGPYTLTAAVPARTLNPTTATASQVGNVLAAVITDLQAKGAIR